MRMCRKGVHDLDAPNTEAVRTTIGGGGVRREYLYCKPCAQALNSAAGRGRRITLKNRVIERYGGKCACCGISRRVFLTLDHIHGGGTAERSGRTDRPYRSADAEFQPNKYQILCFNCNYAKFIEETHTCPQEQ